MVEETIILTDAEKEAKDFLIKIFTMGNSAPIDDCNISEIKLSKPDWIDIEKYKRGQKYFQDNRAGILNSNMNGLIALLAEPKGLETLMMTEKSSSVETSRKRYASTIMHTIAWYDYELKDDSESWKSLERVRKLHLAASKAAVTNKIGFISQTQVTVTSFGFMGFVILKPHILGIRSDVQEDREGFVHLWAVINYLLGVNDEYNMCLFKFETVKVICELILRYIIQPMIQFESPDFKHMCSVMIDGVNPFVPLSSYETQMFLTKRICGIPGYQYDVDISKENLIRNIFTDEDIMLIREGLKNYHDNPFQLVNFNTFQLYEVTKPKDLNLLIKNSEFDTTDCVLMNGTYKNLNNEIITESVNNNNNNKNNINNNSYDINRKKCETLEEKLIEYFHLEPDAQVKIKEIPIDNWQSNLSDVKFKELSFSAKMHIRLRCLAAANDHRLISHTISDWLTGRILDKIRNFHITNKG